MSMDHSIIQSKARVAKHGAVAPVSRRYTHPHHPVHVSRGHHRVRSRRIPPALADVERVALGGGAHRCRRGVPVPSMQVPYLHCRLYGVFVRGVSDGCYRGRYWRQKHGRQTPFTSGDWLRCSSVLLRGQGQQQRTPQYGTAFVTTSAACMYRCKQDRPSDYGTVHDSRARSA